LCKICGVSRADVMCIRCTNPCNVPTLPSRNHRAWTATTVKILFHNFGAFVCTQILPLTPGVQHAPQKRIPAHEGCNLAMHSYAQLFVAQWRASNGRWYCNEYVSIVGPCIHECCTDVHTHRCPHGQPSLWRASPNMRYEPSVEPHPLRECKKVPKYDLVGW
jgi:hypothetical protein